jgi:hypothetical protein
LGRVGEGGTPVTRVPGATPMGDGASGESEVSLDQEGRGGHEGSHGGVIGAAPHIRGDRQAGVE